MLTLVVAKARAKTADSNNRENIDISFLWLKQLESSGMSQILPGPLRQAA
jgi:hypothetical protein